MKKLGTKEKMALGWGILISSTMTILITILLLFNPIDTSFRQNFDSGLYILIFSIIMLIGWYLTRSEYREQLDKEDEEDET
jgi:uncharacterized membrane protein HdeD (DUF308 family)